jgi:hypothetical protein
MKSVRRQYITRAQMIGSLWLADERQKAVELLTMFDHLEGLKTMAELAGVLGATVHDQFADYLADWGNGSK